MFYTSAEHNLSLILEDLGGSILPKRYDMADLIDNVGPPKYFFLSLCKILLTLLKDLRLKIENHYEYIVWLLTINRAN